MSPGLVLSRETESRHRLTNHRNLAPARFVDFLPCRHRTFDDEYANPFIKGFAYREFSNVLN
jgi:hypothetical protein